MQRRRRHETPPKQVERPPAIVWRRHSIKYGCDAAAKLNGGKEAIAKKLVDELICLRRCDEHVTNDAYPTVMRLLYSADSRAILKELGERMETAKNDVLADCSLLVLDMRDAVPEADFSIVTPVLESRMDGMTNGLTRDLLALTLKRIKADCLSPQG